MTCSFSNSSICSNCDTEEWEISPDGSTYTYPEHDAGAAQPVVIILHRAN